MCRDTQNELRSHIGHSRYGNVSTQSIREAYNDLRLAIRKGDIDAAQAALDHYEQWASYVFDPSHGPVQKS